MNHGKREAAIPAISLRGVGKTYVNGELAVEALRDVFLDIHAGEFVAIIGQSGSGKSTLMNILGCLDPPTSGTYLLSGVDIAQLDADEIAHLRRDTFGFVFQSYNLIPTLDAVENVALPATYAGLAHRERIERAEQLLTQLGLENRLDHRPTQLSGGQQQRVSIARALMNGGSILLADEPTGAIDSRSSREVMAILKSMHAAGHTVIVITHDRTVAEHADRIVEIADGRIVGDRVRASSASWEEPVQRTGADRVPRRVRSVGQFLEAIKMGWRALLANPLRTVLTLLGIVIGVAAVIVMMAIGGGSRQDVLDRISGLGSDRLTVMPGVFGGPSGDLTVDDARAIAELPNVRAVVPVNSGVQTLQAGNVNVNASVLSTWPDFPDALSWPVAVGGFFTQQDDDEFATVAVLGRSVAQTLFPGNPNPVGEYFMVGRFPFQVVGVMSAQDSTGSGMGDDDSIFVPLASGNLRLLGQRHVRSLTVIVEDIDRIAQTETAITALLLRRHGQIDFTIRNNASILDAVASTQDTFTILLGSVAAISLLVGGIGIMNIMLVNVTERTREIGIRMATGARMRDILRQFNTEAVVVSAIGGLIGVFVGLSIAWGMQQLLSMSIAFSTTPVALAFGCAFLTGLLFGYMPARKAANLDPAVALATV